MRPDHVPAAPALTPEGVATILGHLARTASTLTVDQGLGAVASLILALIGSDVWAEVRQYLLGGAWASIRTDRARGLRYLAIVVGDVEGTWGPQYPDASWSLQKLRRCLVAASKAEPLSLVAADVLGAQPGDPVAVAPPFDGRDMSLGAEVAPETTPALRARVEQLLHMSWKYGLDDARAHELRAKTAELARREAPAVGETMAVTTGSRS